MKHLVKKVKSFVCGLMSDEFKDDLLAEYEKKGKFDLIMDCVALVTMMAVTYIAIVLAGALMQGA
jgi:hypothetical protein